MIPLIAVGIVVAGLALGVAIVAGHGRRHWGRRLIVVVVLVIAALPIGVIVTLALLPFWRWLEATHAIESVGHSGPADVLSGVHGRLSSDAPDRVRRQCGPAWRRAAV